MHDFLNRPLSKPIVLFPLQLHRPTRHLSYPTTIINHNCQFNSCHTYLTIVAIFVYIIILNLPCHRIGSLQQKALFSVVVELMTLIVEHLLGPLPLLLAWVPNVVSYTLQAIIWLRTTFFLWGSPCWAVAVVVFRLMGCFNLFHRYVRYAYVFSGYWARHCAVVHHFGIMSIRLNPSIVADFTTTTI